MEDKNIYYMFAALVPPEQQKSGEFGYEFKLKNRGELESVEKQIREKKDKITFIHGETGKPVCVNNNYPVVYVTTRIQKVTGDIVIPDGQDILKMKTKIM